MPGFLGFHKTAPKCRVRDGEGKLVNSDDIDEKIAPLVDLLNVDYGVRTLGSCEGNSDGFAHVVFETIDCRDLVPYCDRIAQRLWECTSNDPGKCGYHQTAEKATLYIEFCNEFSRSIFPYAALRMRTEVIDKVVEVLRKG